MAHKPRTQYWIEIGTEQYNASCNASAIQFGHNAHTECRYTLDTIGTQHRGGRLEQMETQQHYSLFTLTLDTGKWDLYWRISDKSVDSNNHCNFKNAKAVPSIGCQSLGALSDLRFSSESNPDNCQHVTSPLTNQIKLIDSQLTTILNHGQLYPWVGWVM